MFGRPQFAAVKEDLDSLGAPTLIKSLRSAVQDAQALVSRDEQLKREIEEKKRENQLLKEKLSEKGKECGDLKELASRTREERDGLIAKLKENEVDKKEIIELKRKNCDLECAKLRAETEVDVYRSRFIELEARVLNLEKELLEMVSKAEKRAEPVNWFTEKDGFVNIPCEPATAGKREASEDFVKSELLSETNANPTGRSSRGKRTEETVVIIDSDDECGSHESASELAKAHPSHNVVENQKGVLKRKPDELDNKPRDVDDNFRTGKSKQAKVAEQEHYGPLSERTYLNLKATISSLVPPNPFNDDSSSFSSSDDDADQSNFVSPLKPESFVYTNPKSRQ